MWGSVQQRDLPPHSLNTHDSVVSGSRIYSTRATLQDRDYDLIDVDTGDFLSTADDSNKL